MNAEEMFRLRHLMVDIHSTVTWIINRTTVSFLFFQNRVSVNWLSRWFGSISSLHYYLKVKFNQFIAVGFGYLVQYEKIILHQNLDLF